MNTLAKNYFQRCLIFQILSYQELNHHVSVYLQPRIQLGHNRVGTEEGPESSTVRVPPALFHKTVKGL